MTIRSRLTAVFIALFGGLLIPFLAVLYFSLSSRLANDFRETIRHDLGQIIIVFGEHGTLADVLEVLYREESDEFKVQVRLLDASEKLVFQSYGFGGSQMESTPLTAPWLKGTLNGDPQLIVRSPIVYLGVPYICEVWKSQADLLAIRRELLFILCAGVPLVLALSVLAGYFFAGRALAPMDDLRRKADQMESSNLSARLPLPPNRDELHRLASTLNSLLSRIESSFESMKRFTADASHELRIPLTNLRGIMEVNLTKKRSQEEHEEDLRDALEEVHRLTKLTTDLLLLATVDAKKLTMRKDRVDVAALLDDVREDARRMDPEEKLTFSVVAPVRLFARADGERIRQLLYILIDNAIKYTPAGGRVTLGAVDRADATEIYVADTGEGISEDEQEHIFQRFYRVDKSRSRDGGGSGLGLSIARAIADGHGGRLTVDSAIGRGSAFRLTLPHLPD